MREKSSNPCYCRPCWRYKSRIYGRNRYRRYFRADSGLAILRFAL